MAVKVIHKCDKCGNEWERDLPENKNKQIWTIGIGISHGANTMPISSALKTQQWCRACIEHIGLLPLAPPPKEGPKIIEKTFEDRIVELLNELGFEQTQ